VVGIRGDRSPAADNRVVDTRVVDSRAAALAVDTPVLDTPGAGTAVDQASQAEVRGVREEVSSPANAPDVVAHEPILSISRVFLNVPPISVA